MQSQEQVVIINGVSIPVPEPIADPYSCTIEQLERNIRENQLYESRVADATAGNFRPDSLYAMPMDELKQKAQEQHEAAEAERIARYHDEQAKIFLANEPRFISNPQNGKILADEVQRRGLAGSVYDISQCFDHLVATGQIEYKFIAPKVELHPDLSNASLEEIQRLVDAQIRAEQKPAPFEASVPTLGVKR